MALPLPETPCIAERQVQAVLSNGQERTITVRLYQPFSREDPDFWFTPYTIEGVEPEEISEVFGPGDSMSSLSYALFHVGLRLLAYSERGIKLTWLGTDDLGFPDTRYGLGRPPRP